MSQSHTYVGIEIGGTKLQVVAGDSAGKITRRWRGRVEPHQTGLQIQHKIAEGLKIVESTPAAVAAGFGGPVDWRSGRIARSHQVEGWEGINLAEWISSQTGAPAVVENDANVAALGEAIAGAGREMSPVFYVTLGSGVGGGLVIDGRIYHGSPPGEAEFGHLRLDPDGTTVESRCSGWAIDRRVRAAIAKAPTGLLASLSTTTQGAEARLLAAGLGRDDAPSNQILAELTADLSFALSHVVHLLHPRVIILGGGLSLLGEPLRQAVAEALPIRIMQVFRPGPSVRLASLGEDAVPIGALLLAAASSAARNPS